MNVLETIEKQEDRTFIVTSNKGKKFHAPGSNIELVGKF
jgi:hypothetical protein